MKVYEIKKKDNAPNVFGISLVGVPAMESNYIALSKTTVNLSKEEKIALSNQNDIKLSQINKEKRLLLGLVLEPNKMIYRYNEQTNEEYYITVSEETILELQADYIKQSNQNYSTLEHDGKELDGITFTQHWIVEDSKIDKSALHGMSFKKGSWVTVAKIENDTLWNDYIKTGSVMGFSIDALVHLEEVNLNKQETMSEQKTVIELLKDLPNQIKLALTPKKVELTEEEKVEAEKIRLAEEEKNKVKKYEDMTDEEKKAFDAKKKKDDEVDKDKVITSEDKPLEVEKFDMEAFKQAMTEMGLEFSTVVKEALQPLETKNVELSEEIKTLQGKVVELSKQPASKAIKTQPTSVDFSKMTPWEKRQYHKNNG